MNKPRLKFKNLSKSSFNHVVKERVNQYFKENKLAMHGDGRMWFKILFIIGGIVSTYLTILYLGANYKAIDTVLLPWIILLLAGLHGVFVALAGLNICHDAIHGSLSNKKWINNLFGMLFNVIGANMYNWKNMHNKAHHIFTNVDEYDEDLETGGFIRLSPNQPWKPIYKFQVFYAWPLYTLSSILWVLWKDYKKFFKFSIGPFQFDSHPKIEYFNLFFFKALYYTLFIVIPFTLIDMHWTTILLGWIFMHLCEGWVLTIVFMMAHVVEGTECPVPKEGGDMETSWAVHQLNTTANFAIDNPWVNFFCGGLNFQIEHHLFAHICHVHYVDLSKIVSKTAEEFGHIYNNNKTFSSAIASHARFINRLGKGLDLEEKKALNTQLA